jgi:hypothetical protein
MLIKKYEGCAVDGHNGIYTGQVFAERYPDILDLDTQNILLAGPGNADYLETVSDSFPLESYGRLFEFGESGDILEYSLVDTDTITVGQLNELAKSVNHGGMSIFENQFGRAVIVQLGENCLCRVSLANVGIISADCFFEMDAWYSFDENLQAFFEFELAPKLREEFEDSHVILALPSYYASYLIDGDASGFEDDEQAEIDNFLASQTGIGLCVGCSEDSWFAGSNDLGNMGADVKEFYFERSK